MDLTGVILLTGIGLVVGFLVATLIFSIRRESTSQEQPKEQLLSDAENKVRLWREGGEERLVVEMNGVSFRQRNKLQPEQKQVLDNVVKELQSWLGASTTPAAAVTHQAVKATPVIEPAVGAQDGTSFNPLKIFGDVLQPQKKTIADERDLSIVAQIDLILQTKIEEAHLEERGIRLVEGPDQGMVIEIGLDRYTNIDAVPDEEVRKLIRLSVAEWEKSLGD
jgi:hypothetical protein